VQQRDRKPRLLRLDLRQQRERLGAREARRRSREDVGREHARPLDLAGCDVRPRRRRRTAIGVPSVARRREPQRLLGELRSRDLRTVLRGLRRGLLERERELLVRPVGRAGEVARSDDGILHEVPEEAVRLLPLARREPLVERRREQRVREPHGPVHELEDVLGERVLEGALADPRLGELGEGQARLRRDEHERVASSPVEPAEPRGDELLEALGDRQWSRGVTDGVAGVERTRELEGVERVASRDLVDAEQRRPGDDPGEPPLDDPLDRTEAQRADPKALDPLLADGVLEGGRRPALAETSRPEQQDRRLGEPADREPERVGGGRVEPLDVVDRDDERALLGQRLERAANADAERTRIDRPAGGVLDEQGDFERTPLRCRECGKRLVEHVLEEVGEPSVLEAALGLRRPRDEDARAALPRRIERRTPESGLPDPGLPLERDRRRRATGEERPERAELIVPAHQVDRHRTPRTW
jgi:hypothetical protein